MNAKLGRPPIDPTKLRTCMTVWGIAQESKAELVANPTDSMRREIVRTAMGHGFFSVWIKVFTGDVVMRQMLIDGFGVAENYRRQRGVQEDFN